MREVAADRALAGCGIVLLANAGEQQVAPERFGGPKLRRCAKRHVTGAFPARRGSPPLKYL